MVLEIMGAAAGLLRPFLSETDRSLPSVSTILHRDRVQKAGGLVWLSVTLTRSGIP